MTDIAYRYCRRCGGRFIRTAGEPVKDDCGACPLDAGSLAAAAVRKAHGFERRRDVPADGGTVKVCPRCDQWFSARPRERVCFGCTPAFRRTLKARSRVGVLGSLVNVANAQHIASESGLLGVTFSQPVKVWRGLALEAAACIDGKRPGDAWKRNPLAPR